VALFTVAELRAFDHGQCADVVDYPEGVITQAAADAKEFLEHICRINFEPTLHVETKHGDGSDWLFLDWPKVTNVSAITVDGVALTAEEIDTDDYDVGLSVDCELGILTRRCGYFAKGWSNVVVSYEAGHATVPALIKRAALWVALDQLVVTTVPYEATDFSTGDVSYGFARADGYNDNWHKNPEVAKAIRAYKASIPWIA